MDVWESFPAQSVIRSLGSRRHQISMTAAAAAEALVYKLKIVTIEDFPTIARLKRPLWWRQLLKLQLKDYQ